MNRHERRKEAKLEREPIKRKYNKLMNQKKSKWKPPELQSLLKRVKNVQKHIRLAKATRGSESRVHQEKAGKLIEKYEFDK